MTPEQWQQAREVLADALELKAEERPAFLDRACSSDHLLRQEVERLLASSDEARSGFLQSSIFQSGLAPGMKLGEYEVGKLLGAGGMGEVYRARDTRLGRDVAIKVLPTYFSQDPERLRRFEQEARAAAALNHPNILAVFQMGTHQGAPYLVSELLEGGTLRDQLVRGPMPLRKAIDCGVQIARGLAAAHEKGIVHRDLKPENLFLVKDGRVKILDFGLAKLTQQPSAAFAGAPTGSIGTEPGVVMGTAGYMSPEQVSGKQADYRTDIFSFGAILYEMLAGKRAFQKPTSAETMSAILNEEPRSISQITPSIPPALGRIVQRCMEKNPEQRFQSASDLAFALEALSDSGSATILDSGRTGIHHAYRWAAAGVILLVSVLAAVFYLNRSAEAPIVPTLTRLTWDSGLTTDPALSPDGKLLAYSSDRSGEGHFDLYVKQIAGGEPLRLTSGPGDKRTPTFSPDGTAIAFQSTDPDGIYLVSTLGGNPRKVASDGAGPKFSPDGKWIAYSVGAVASVSLNIPGNIRIYVVPLAGGVPKQVRPDFAAAIDPVWAPDGEHLLFLGNPDASKEDTVDWWVTALDDAPATRTGALDAMRKAKLSGDLQGYPEVVPTASWVPGSNSLIFSARVADSFNLWRMKISPTTFKIVGSPERLTSGLAREEYPSVISTADGTTRVAFTSTNDNIAVWSLPIKANEGKVSGELQQLTHDPGGDFMPYISQDGSKIVYVSTRPGNQEILSRDLRTGQESSLTASHANKYEPILSPDGSLVSFSESPAWDVYLVPSSGGAAEMLCGGCGEVTDWSRDGKRVLGNTLDGRAWLLEVTSRRKSELLATHHWIATDSFSPDNRWFSFIDVGRGFHRAYIAGMSATPIPESAWISIMDGEIQAWSPDGNLVYAISFRDGHTCIWAQRLDPVTKHPLGSPFAVFHSHDARLSLSNQTEATLSMGNNRMVFSMGERTGNIWMAEWKER